MKKIKLRMAQLVGNGIKKRCRNSSFVLIQAIGENDQEAIENFNKKLIIESGKYKSWTLKNFGLLFDIESLEGILTVPLLPDARPQDHNTLKFQYTETLKS